MLSIGGNAAYAQSLLRMKSMRSEERSSVSDVMNLVRSGYFGTSMDMEIDTAISDMIDDVLQVISPDHPSDSSTHIARVPEGYALFGLGESGVRKTSTFVRALYKRPEFEGFERGDGNTSMAISLTAPAPFTLAQLGKAMLTAMGAQGDKLSRENAIWEAVRDILPRRGIRFVHIDEAQHAVDGHSEADVKRVQDTIKDLLQDSQWPVWVILTGLPSAATLAEGDFQVNRRKRVISFPPLTFQNDAATVKKCVEFFAVEKAGLSLDFELSDLFAHRLMHSSLFRLGMLIDMTQWAILQALKDTPRSTVLTIRHFERAFEVWSGCVPVQNVFRVANFDGVDVGKFLTRQLDAKPESFYSKKKGRK